MWQVHLKCDILIVKLKEYSSLMQVKCIKKYMGQNVDYKLP